MDLLLINSFSFCMSKEIFISSLILKGIFAGRRIEWFVAFSTPKILLSCFLICIVSYEKCVIFVFLYIKFFFSPCFSGFHLALGFEQFHYYLPLYSCFVCVCVCSFLLIVHWAFLFVGVKFSSNMENLWPLFLQIVCLSLPFLLLLGLQLVIC